MDSETIELLSEIRTLLRLKICQDALKSDDLRVPDLRTIAVAVLHPGHVYPDRKDWVEPYKTFAETAIKDMKVLGLLPKETTQ